MLIHLGRGSAPLGRVVSTLPWYLSQGYIKGGVSPTLILQFDRQRYAANGAEKSFSDILTFARSTTATYFDANGVMQTAAINTPRFDHNPATGEALGLLVEGARTNLVLNSATGTNQSITTTATTYTLSFFGTGTVTLSGTYSGSLVGTGAYPTRSTLTFTTTAGTLTLSVSGTIQYIQIEAGAFASSYIPTTSAAVTRAAETVQNASSNTVKFADWYNQSGGSVFLKTNVDFHETNVLGRTAVSIEADAGNYIRVYGFSGGQNFLAEIKTAYSSVMARYAQTMVPKRTYTQTVRLETNNSAYFVNAQDKGTDVTCTLPTPTKMGIGYNPATGGQLFGHILEFRYYPVAIGNAILQSMTLDYLTEGDSYMAGYLGYGIAQSLLDSSKVLSNTSVGGSTLADQVTRIEALAMAGLAPLIHCDGSINGYSTTEVDMALYQRIYDACNGNVVFITPCIYTAIAGTEMGTRTQALTDALVAAYPSKVVNLMDLAASMYPHVDGHVNPLLLAADELHPNDLFADALAAAAVAKL